MQADPLNRTSAAATASGQVVPLSKEALLLDMDGVIIDSMPCHVAAWLRALSEFGFHVDEEILYLHEGAIEPETAVKIFSGEGCLMDSEKFHEVFMRQKEIFVSEFRHQVRPFPLINDILAQLKREGLRMALVTSSHRDILDAVLPADLLGIFDHVVTGDRVSRRKPHPAPYLAALKGLEAVSPGMAAAVENAPAGIRSAKAAGLMTIAITTTLAPQHLMEADMIISSHAELLGEIAGIEMFIPPSSTSSDT